MHHPTDSIAHTTAFVTPVVEHWLDGEINNYFVLCLYGTFICTYVYILCPQRPLGLMQIKYLIVPKVLTCSPNASKNSDGRV